MNNKMNISKKIIKKTDSNYNSIALRNKWAVYNIVTFEDTKEKEIILSYQYSKEDSIDIIFIKE